jgi:hypothetical protein
MKWSSAIYEWKRFHHRFAKPRRNPFEVMSGGLYWRRQTLQLKASCHPPTRTGFEFLAQEFIYAYADGKYKICTVEQLVRSTCKFICPSRNKTDCRLPAADCPSKSECCCKTGTLNLDQILPDFATRYQIVLGRPTAWWKQKTETFEYSQTQRVKYWRYHAVSQRTSVRLIALKLDAKSQPNMEWSSVGVHHSYELR